MSEVDVKSSLPEFEHPWRLGTFPCRFSHRRIPVDGVGFALGYGSLVVTENTVGLIVRFPLSLNY